MSVLSGRNSSVTALLTAKTVWTRCCRWPVLISPVLSTNLSSAATLPSVSGNPGFVTATETVRTVRMRNRIALSVLLTDHSSAAQQGVLRFRGFVIATSLLITTSLMMTTCFEKLAQLICPYCPADKPFSEATQHKCIYEFRLCNGERDCEERTDRTRNSRIAFSE